MKVWVLVDELEYEGGDPIAVFSTLGSAIEHKEDLEVQIPDERSLVVFEFELDKKPCPHWFRRDGGV